MIEKFGSSASLFLVLLLPVFAFCSCLLFASGCAFVLRLVAVLALASCLLFSVCCVAVVFFGLCWLSINELFKKKKWL